MRAEREIALSRLEQIDRLSENMVISGTGNAGGTQRHLNVHRSTWEALSVSPNTTACMSGFGLYERPRLESRP